MLLTTRPWTLTEAMQFEQAAEMLRDRKTGLPRRKREQLDDILRRGHVLSLVAWEAWWKGLRDHERCAVRKASGALEAAGWGLPDPRDSNDPRVGCEALKWDRHLTLSPWIHLGEEPKQGGDQNQENRPRHYYATPLLDLLTLDNLASSAGGETADGGNEMTAGATDGPRKPAGGKATGEAHA